MDTREKVYILNKLEEMYDTIEELIDMIDALEETTDDE